MRVLTVLSIMTLGAGLGTAAVLVPLSSTPSASRSDWPVNWGVPAIRKLVAMLPDTAGRDAATLSTNSGTSTPASDATAQATATVHVAPAARNQDHKTFEVLTQQADATSTAGSRLELQPWTTTTIPSGAIVATRGGRPSSKPANEDQRYQLVRAIQTELTRVGCYTGGADGQWTAATKRAMGQFNDRLNATLPYDDPDLILLTLVKGHRGIACGETCPAGQQMTEGGLCKPSSVLAHADRPKTLRRPRPEQQPAAVASTAAAKPAEPSFGTTTVIAASEPEQTVQVDQAGATAPETAYGVTVRSALPLPGRMAIGGPLPQALPEVRQPVTEGPLDDQADAQASVNRQRKQHQAGPGRAPARAPQVSAAQPRKQRWHPNNPFWLSN